MKGIRHHRRHQIRALRLGDPVPRKRDNSIPTDRESSRFLGHLTEDGRVIEFPMERVQNARHAGPPDLETCRETLS